MARLESQAKKGYYKTPSHLLPLIAQYLKINKEEADLYRLLDPCCGKGEALFLLGKNLGLNPHCLYGNELDEARYNEARKIIPNCLYGDAIWEIRTSPCGFSLLYENPPYDFEGDGQGRTEFKFLKAHYRLLAQNGIFVFVVPEPILSRPEFIKALPVWFKDIRIFRFPPEDYPVFKQVVLFGKKRRAKTKKEEVNYLSQLANPLTLGDPCDIEYELTKVPFPISFTSNNISLSQAQEMLKHRAITQALKLGLEQESNRKIKSLMPLRSGHQALLLASGVMDGVYRDPETGNLLIIRGTVEQEIETREEVDETSKSKSLIRRKKPVAKVVALDLTATKELHEVKLVEFK